ncbi:FAD-dependent oxidoreductase [Escherichia coli]|nr:FAD-dependent oxidoreductase [Escherichia coli]
MRRLNKRGGRISSLETSHQGTLTGDEYVVAAGNGSGSPAWASGGSRAAVLPEGVQPDPALSWKSRYCPWTSAVTDYGHKIVYARLGQQLRIAAMVDIGYDGDELRECRIQALKNIVARSFPELEGAGRGRSLDRHAPVNASRPASMLGRAGYPNLWMNLGQGSLGFTLAAGSAVVLGALIDNQMPDISLEGPTWKQTA